MRRLMLLILIAGLLALPALGADEPKPAKTITMEFYGLALSHVLDLLAAVGGISYAVLPPELANRPITINASGTGPVDLQGALDLLRAAGIDNTRVGDTYVFYARSGTAAATPGPVVSPPAAGEEPKVSLGFRDASLDEVLRAAFADAPYSFALGPDALRIQHVALSLQNVPFSAALQAIAQAANVDIIREPGNSTIYRVVPRPTVTMGGTQIPVVGAVTVGAGGGGGAAGGDFVWPSGAPTFTWPAGVPLPSAGGPQWPPSRLEALPSAPALPVAEPGQKLVDLDVRDMPIREAMARLAKASGFQITVHPAVPKDIKVTARAFGVPAEWLLDQIVEQAHLTVVREAVKGKPSAAKAYRYHIVPPPEIKVSGAPNPPRPFREFALPRWVEPGPQRMPIAGNVFFLQSDPATPAVPMR